MDTCRGRVMGSLVTLGGLLGPAGMIFASLAGGAFGVAPVLALEALCYLLAGGPAQLVPRAPCRLPEAESATASGSYTQEALSDWQVPGCLI